MTYPPLPIGKTYETAQDVVGIFQMWEINKNDALAICNHMISIIGKIKDSDWEKHQLKDTGLVVPGHRNFKDDKIN